jgi:hypothetical protein
LSPCLVLRTLLNPVCYPWSYHYRVPPFNPR